MYLDTALHSFALNDTAFCFVSNLDKYVWSIAQNAKLVGTEQAKMRSIMCPGVREHNRRLFVSHLYNSA